MALRAVDRSSDEAGFILTDVSQHYDYPGLWGFEVFTDKWRQLARFTYDSEVEAIWALTNFAWVMGRISSTVTV
jgi:hypothetical protein